ncbi:MAG: VIT domain-containing protein [Xenococcaceae cyanobacterium]
MTTSTPQESTADNQNRCYCLNPDCQKPENPRDTLVCESCGSNLLLQERYRAIEPLGQGGFGRTFKAVDESQPSQPYCAIKQFFPQQVNNAEKAAELFRQEAQRLETLGNHPQIPKLLGYFIEEERQYLVQEFIHGPNLAQELAEEWPFTESQIRQLLLDLLPVLRYVHDRQVIHRDIKPENIIRRQTDGCLMLVDFGAAKYATETTLGKTGTVIGSAAYIAPEQVRGKAVYSSDIYSLGVTCIHLLTQIPPFDLFDSTEDAWVWRHFLDSNSVSKSLGKILDKMLQSATKRRYRSAGEVLKDLNSPPIFVARQTKWLVASAVLLFALVGVRYLLYPVTQQVSTRNPEVVRERDEQSPSTGGGLFSTVDGKQQAFPLQHTEVTAKIAGNVSRVEVTQTFANPYDKPLEAVYKFPLPDEAAVDDMEIRIGDRIIRGTIKKREEAKQIYEQAKREGKTAGLLEQERANIFTQSLANILPGEKIDVTIRYTNSLKFEGGDYEFAFPMVVGPRYMAARQVSLAGYTTAKLNPPVLSPDRSGQDINVTVEIDAGVPISKIESPSHEVNIQRASSTMRVKLANEDTIPNKDLILRYRVAGASTQATVLTQSNQQGGHFATYLIPAVKYNPKEIVPKDVVFLIDTSGSQGGFPIEQSKELMRQFINGLNPKDTFTIIDFASTTTKLSPKPLPNTQENRQRAIAYVNSLRANGGTELMNGMNEVLNFPPAPEGRLRSVVLLTDGLIGNDKQIIGEVQKRLKSGNRLYSFGVGSSTNRFLINRLAEVGRGTAEVLPPNEPAQKVAEKFFREINNPVLTNVEVTWIGSGEAPEIYPLAAPDLFANQPLVLYGRKKDHSSGQLRITGTVAGGKRYEKILNVNFEQVSGNGAIAQLWGRARIKDLMNQMHWEETPAGVEAVTNTALDYRLLSEYTAFVAVTEEVRVDPKDATIKEEVAVEMPAGMSPEAKLNSPVPKVNVQPSKPSKSKPSWGKKSSDVPEPGQIWGNLLALLLLVLFFYWKRLKKSKSIPPSK